MAARDPAAGARRVTDAFPAARGGTLMRALLLRAQQTKAPKPGGNGALLAESKRFELLNGFPRYTISNRAPSATRTTLLGLVPGRQGPKILAWRRLRANGPFSGAGVAGRPRPGLQWRIPHGGFMSTLDDIRSLVGELAQAPVPADPDASLFEAGVIDSFGVMDLVGKLEVAFGIQVPDADMLPRKFETLARIAAYVDTRRG